MASLLVIIRLCQLGQSLSMLIQDTRLRAGDENPARWLGSLYQAAGGAKKRKNRDLSLAIVFST